jgi:DNA invertase Pin-like site-specific DNA recombinase
MRAASYLRVSSEHQADEERASLPQQAQDIEALCERLDYTVVAGFQDTERYRATRGKQRGKMVEPSSERWDRPGYQALCEAIKAGQVDVVASQRWDPDVTNNLPFQRGTPSITAPDHAGESYLR